MSDSAERKMTALDDFVMAFVRIGRDMSVPIPVRNFATNCRDRLQEYILASSERREPPAPLISWAKEFIAKHNRIRKKFYRDVAGACSCNECSELKHILERAASASEPAATPGLEQMVVAVQEFLKHDGGPGSEDYDAAKIYHARRSMQSSFGFRCPKCGETLPHLYDENCTDYRAASVSPVGPEPESPWINVEERLPEANDEFLVKCSDCDYAIPADWFDGTWKTMRGYGNEGEALELHLVTHWMLMPDPPEAVGPEPAKE